MNRVNKKNQENERALVFKSLEEELNKNHEKSLVLLVKHFGERKDARNVRLSDIDDGGFTLQWEFGKEKEVEDMTFAFRSKKNTNAEITREIAELVGKAREGLKEKDESELEKMYKTRRALEFHLNKSNAAITLAMLVLNIYIALFSNPVPFAFLHNLISQSTAWRILKIAGMIHLFEAVVVFGVCKIARAFFPEEMTDKDEWMWVMHTLLVGVNSSVPLLKKTWKVFTRNN
ncbi:hypothetical protein BB558_005127 [Smittium angustum]|uniref:DUF2470 domain-containing protein n=1 Tax=Smittium angustum TaxID=133377 RepID=A0A2U1J1G7_SMIAN|nr:hypothetical protein BB558_005127 [Smittium angustum]